VFGPSIENPVPRVDHMKLEHVAREIEGRSENKHVCISGVAVLVLANTTIGTSLGSEAATQDATESVCRGVGHLVVPHG
jgi:hypothetical protein